MGLSEDLQAASQEPTPEERTYRTWPNRPEKGRATDYRWVDLDGMGIAEVGATLQYVMRGLDDAYLSLSVDDGHDGCTASASVVGHRPMTPNEVAAAEAQADLVRRQQEYMRGMPQ